MLRRFCAGVVAFAGAAGWANAGTDYLMIPDSSANRILLLDAFDGNLVNPDFIVAPAGGFPFSFGTPKHAIQVGNEIWIADQINDEIYRFTATLTPVFIGTITGQLDNIRGMGVLNNRVYVSNDGGANGATPDSIAVYDFAGNRLNTFSVSPNISPFSAEPFMGDILVSRFDASGAIDRFTTDGAYLGQWQIGTLSTTQQIHVANTGPMGETEVWAAAFPSTAPTGGLFRYDANGNQIGYFSAVRSLRGCFALGDGQILVTSGGTIQKVDPVSGLATSLLFTSSSQYAGKLTPTATPPSTNPFVNGVSVPVFAEPGQSVTLTATVIPGTLPASTGVVVTADLTAFGGSASQALVDQGSNVHTYNLSIPMAQGGGQYQIPISVTDAQMRSGSQSIALLVLNGFFPEMEFNSSKFDANAFSIAPGGGVVGVSTGAATNTDAVNSADYFLLTTPAAAPAIYRHRMVILTPGTAGHSGTIRGLTQTAGVINGFTDSGLQTSSTTTNPPRMNQWYGFGPGTQIYYRVSGGTSTTDPYFSTLETEAVQPLELESNLAPGNITISRGVGNTATLDVLVYDGNYEAIDDFNADSATSFTRTFAAGTYYLAVSNVNTADSRPAGTGSGSFTQSVCDFPGVVVNTSTAAVANLSMRFQDSDSNIVEIFANKGSAFEVVWIKFVVGTPVVPCPGNYNGDGAVDLLDLLAFNAEWSANLGQVVTPGTNGDFNSDGNVDLLDLLAFNAAWSANLGNPCP